MLITGIKLRDLVGMVVNLAFTNNIGVFGFTQTGVGFEVGLILGDIKN